jgi:TPR repeat protein
VNAKVVRQTNVIHRHLELAGQKLRALLGDEYMCHHLGARYATGDHGEWPDLKDDRSAVRWYHRGAARGNAGCQYDLGFMYILGEGGPKDPQAGIALMVQAAAQGYCEAIRLLADLFSSGKHGVAPDPAQAQHWAHVLSEHLAAHPEDKRLYER